MTSAVIKYHKTHQLDQTTCFTNSYTGQDVTGHLCRLHCAISLQYNKLEMLHMVMQDVVYQPYRSWLNV
jgi:hypothetical protein